MSGDFSDRSVCHGLVYGQPDIAALPAATKKRIIRLLARVQEQAYRRGLQEGQHQGQFGGLTIEDCVHLRYDFPLDVAPLPRGKPIRANGMTSAMKLLMVNPELFAIGLGDT